MGTTSEEFLNRTNASVFLREFTFDRNWFSPEPGADKEFADSVLWLDRYLAIFQVKEREATARSDEDSLRNWHAETVVKLGSRQVRDTLSYLSSNPEIALLNKRSHRFNLNTGSFEAIVKAIVFYCAHTLPSDCTNKRFHISTSTGKRIFIHIIELADYRLICEVLLTPIEVIEYLCFREKLLQSILDACSKPEKWIIGRYLMSPEVPSILLDRNDRDFSEAVDNLQENMEKFQVRHFLEQMYDRMIVYESGSETGYYRMLVYLALLNRNGLSALHQRLKLSFQAAQRNDQTIPYRFEIPKLGCGYVITSIVKEDYTRRHQILGNFVSINMYERKLERCVGISVSIIEGGFDIDWCFLERKWCSDPEMERLLREVGSPFRPVKEQRLLAYDTKIGQQSKES